MTTVEMSYQKAKQFLQDLALPADAKVTLSYEVVTPEADFPVKGQVDFTKIDAFGIWSDREEMSDSTAYVREMRVKDWGH